MKIITIIGARPQFIKAAMLSKALANYKHVKEIIIHTGQHFDANMSAVFFNEMKVPTPSYFLNIHSLNHGAMTGQMISSIEPILIEEKPDVVVVFGDTNTTLAAAIAASKLHIKIAHIEAGLRSFNMEMPEEINRILTDRLSHWLFCPTQTAIDNLKKEGFEAFKCNISQCGDIMFDAVLHYAHVSDATSTILNEYELKDYVLATVHRAENTNNIQKLGQILLALNEINKKIRVVVPMHPRTKALIEKNNLITEFLMIDPVGYIDMIALTKNSSMVLTDSGGLQKEAFFFEKHCVILRHETEWTELVQKGYHCLAGTNAHQIVEAYKSMIEKKSDFKTNIFGNGKTAELIAESLVTIIN